MTQTETRTRTTLFERLAGWAYRRRWWAVLAWLVVLAAVTAGSQAVGADYRNDFSLPGTESQAALDRLRADAPEQAAATVEIVLQAPAGLLAVRDRVEPMLDRVRGLPHVAAVQSPYQDPATIAPDGTIGYATVVLDREDPPDEAVRRLIETAQAAGGEALRVELGGDSVRDAEESGSEGPPAEAVGLLAALVILVLVFGSLLAASLPIVTAIFAVAGSLGLVVLASRAATVADFTPYVMVLVGLGVGIDYALLVFARFRGELGAGRSREEATRTALDTAGRTVFFAGSTVIIALLGLVALGLGSLQGVAVAVAATVLVTMLAALTLLPALLAIAGRRIERRIRRRRRERDGAGWRRWAGLVQRRPWLAALLPAAGLLALALPALDMRLGFADAGNDPESATSRQAYDLLAEGFGPGFNGPLLVVADGEPGRLVETLAGTPGVAAAFPAGSSPDVSTVVVVPSTAPQAEETTELVTRLREQVLPPLERETGASYLVGGSTAAAVDFADAVAGRFALFIVVVVGLSAVLLLVVFRSLLIPVKAAILNLLSIGASLGVVTLVFQEGWLGDLLGVEPGPVEAFVPVMIFAIIFGLSMDYEIFLLSRMHEEWERHGDAPAAIRGGLATTGRVVTAAAAIMIVVFGSFLLSPDRMLKQFGLGLAVAVFVDAVVIRCLILPAVMQLLGRRAWWLPGPLARVLPRLALERASLPTSSAGSPASAPASPHPH
jgi:RND superfamily putative drug exporter